MTPPTVPAKRFTDGVARWVVTSALSAGLTLPCPAFADAPTAASLALEAKSALDAHYGNREQITLAAELLVRALALDVEVAAVYVQAARLTVKGGHVASTRFRPGTLEAYAELLDRALSLEPSNPKAHILKAEYFHLRGDPASERASLDRARATGTQDRWLQVGYGRLHRTLGDRDLAIAVLSDVRGRGPGVDLEQRNAYVSALEALATVASDVGDETALRELVQETRQARDPRDAWALGKLADSLVWAGMFDEAITLSREALRVFSYGAGRLTLAAALFGRAAELSVTGRGAAAQPLLAEARSHGFDRSSVLRRFNSEGAKTAPMLRSLEALVP